MATLNIKGLPERLYRKLKARAKREHRSITQEVTHILERALEEPEPVSILELKGLGRQVWDDVNATSHVATERDSWE